MNGYTELARDVAFFLVESTLESAFLCLLVFVVTRQLAIRNPWLAEQPLVDGRRVSDRGAAGLPHSVAPLQAAARDEATGTPLAGLIAWLGAHEVLLCLVAGAALSLLFSLDVIRWLIRGLRAGAVHRDCEPGAEQATRCAAAVREMGWRSGLSNLPEVIWCSEKRSGVYSVRWPRPCIFLPVACVRELDAGELRAMVAHELAHLKRRDWLRLLAGQLGQDLTFFNPLAHLAYAQYLQATEEAADDAAVIATADRLSPALCLLKVQAHMHEQPAGASGFVHRPTNLVRRVARLVRGEAAGPYPKWQPRAGWAISAIGMLMAAVV